MRVDAVLLAAALVLVAPLPLALGQVGGMMDQTPARDSNRPRTGTSRIAGRVVSAETGAPIRRAVVRLASMDGVNIGQSGVMTDADGNFEFKNLPAGSYGLFASKSGFLSAQQLPGGMPVRTIKLADNEAVTGAQVAMTRAGAIGGRVLDEFGEPVANAYVQVWRRQSVQGVKRLMQAGSSNGGTNDLGQYRVFGLQPGTYFVSATARPQDGSDLESPDRTGYAPTYYPGTTSVSDAQPIEIGAGQDASGIDLMLSVAHLGRVSGVILTATGQRPQNTNVMAMLSVPGGGSMPGGSMGAQVQQDGSFVLPSLPPGDYVLTARAYSGGRGGGPQDQMEMGQARVHVAGDVTGVVIQMSNGSTLSGQVVYDGNTPRTAAAPRLSIMTSPADPFDNASASMGSSSTQVQADGTFVLRSLFGERTLRVGAPSGWMLKAIFVNGHDVSDTPISFDGRESVTGVQVVLTDRVTHVSGAVTDELGNTPDAAIVIVIPADAGKPLFNGRYMRNTTARGGNPWKIDALPPGDYVAIALRYTQGLDTQDSDFLDQVRKTGMRFTVREGETKDVPLKLSTVPKG